MQGTSFGIDGIVTELYYKIYSLFIAQFFKEICILEYS